MRKFISRLLLPCLLPLGLFAQPDFKKLAGELTQTPRQHPYLMFTADEKPGILQRIHGDQRSAGINGPAAARGPAPALRHGRARRAAREMHTRYVGADEYRAFVNRHVQAAFHPGVPLPDDRRGALCRQGL